MMEVDLNCDLGESFGVYQLGNDQEMMKYITSANIACGFHAGDPITMRKAVVMALNNHVSIGAHPGLADLRGFGRRNIHISASDAYHDVVYQIGALDGFVKSEGGILTHVKPHGALYNLCAIDDALAEAVAEAVYRVNPFLRLYGLSGSKLIEAGRKLGLLTVNEVFADRAYLDNGSLAPRDFEGAVISNNSKLIEQVIQLVLHKKVTTITGKDISLQSDSICLHGDAVNAVEMARLISTTLKEHEVQLKSIS
jgi:5-oxoprolinase (ATP-hydrolysing) subunit A